MTVDQIIFIELLVGMVGIVVFTIVYGLRSRWWKYLEGWALMSRSTALSLISLLTIAFLIWGEYPLRDPVRVCVFFFFLVSSWFSVVVLFRRQHLDRLEHERLFKELQDAHEREGKSQVIDREDPPGLLAELRKLVGRFSGQVRDPE